MINLVVVEGVLTRPAQDRQLPSGSRLLTFEVTVRPADGPAETVPVAWFDAPAWATSLDENTAVVVIGRVRRRFFRALGGATQSRTEVVAERVVRVSDLRRARAAMAAAGAAVEAAAAALGPESRKASAPEA
jgi:single-stranded DNA-binding protein